MVFTIFWTGSMKGHGTHWAALLAALFIQAWCLHLAVYTMCYILSTFQCISGTSVYFLHQYSGMQNGLIWAFELLFFLFLYLLWLRGQCLLKPLNIDYMAPCLLLQHHLNYRKSMLLPCLFRSSFCMLLSRLRYLVNEDLRIIVLSIGIV